MEQESKFAYIAARITIAAFVAVAVAASLVVVVATWRFVT